MKFFSTIPNLLRGLHEKLTHKPQMYLLSFITGLSSGLAAVVLKNTVHFTLEFVSHQRDVSHINYLYFIFPLIGI